jgi:hypothetical protein
LSSFIAPAKQATPNNRLPFDQDAERAVISLLLSTEPEGDPTGRFVPQGGGTYLDGTAYDGATSTAGPVPAWRAEVYGQVRAIVQSEDFFLPGYRRVFEAAFRLFDAGEPVTARRVAQAVGQTDVESIATLLTIAGETVIFSRWEWYVQRVHDMAVKRHLFQAAQEIARMACDPEMTADNCRNKAIDLLAVTPIVQAMANGIELFA